MRQLGLMAAVALALLSGCSNASKTAGLDTQTTFQDVSAQPHRPLQTGTANAAAMIFITTDCPIANGYAPEINDIVRDYSDRGIRFYLVHVDPDVSAEKARDHAVDYGYRCTVLMDPDHRLAKAMGVSVTPEAAVIGTDQQLLYRGRIDDRYQGFGKRRFEPSQRDLRAVLDAILNGQPVPNPRTQAIGCPIPE